MFKKTDLEVIIKIKFVPNSGKKSTKVYIYPHLSLLASLGQGANESLNVARKIPQNLSNLTQSLSYVI
jgi:hypothetical protein